MGRLIALAVVLWAGAAHAQVLHDPAVIHDTINYGSGGNGNATYAANAGNANTANYATNAGNANTANFATNAGNAATATSATSATSATTSGSTQNVTSGGNVVTSNVTAATACFSPQYTTANNTLYMGPTGNPNAFAVASYPDTAFSTTEIGVLVPARVNANGANFNSGALAFGGFDDNHAGLVGQAPNAGNAAGFQGGSLILRTGNGGSTNTPYLQASAYYAPGSGPYHAQNGGTAASPVFQMCSTVTAGVYTNCSGIHASTGSGILYLDAGGTTVQTLDGPSLTTTLAGPLVTPNVTANQNVTISTGQLFLPNSGGGNSSSIYFGPRTAAGVQIFRITNGILGFSLGDNSGNAQLNASRFQSLNQGNPTSPQIAYSNAPGYGLHWDSTHFYVDAGSAIATAWDSTGAMYGQKTSTVSKTANYTLVSPLDNGVHFDNTGATGAITLTLITPTAGQNGCVTTTAAQSVAVTTPSGAILGGSFTSGATRTTTAQYTTWCWEAHGGNYYITSLVGTIAS